MTKTRSSVKRKDLEGQVKPDTRYVQSALAERCRLVTKHEAAQILGVSPETLKRYRLAENSTLIEGIHYHVWNSRVIRYNAELLTDWGVNRHNPQAHQRAIESYLASLPSNQPLKRGRKVS